MISRWLLITTFIAGLTAGLGFAVGVVSGFAFCASMAHRAAISVQEVMQ